MFEVKRTWTNPAENSGQGFPAPGAGAQSVGEPIVNGMWPAPIEYSPERPFKGLLSWLFPTRPEDAARGFPEPENALQHRPPGSMPNSPPIFGDADYVYTPYYSRGAAAYAPNFGTVLTNPIGAGRVVSQRPQASYGPSGEYINGAIFWTSQAIPTNVGLNGLQQPEVLEALLGQMRVQGVVRVERQTYG